MSLDIASERVCYVHCNFCNTILATIPLQALQRQLSYSFQDVAKTCESESKFRNFTQFEASGHELRIPPIRSLEKRQRVPSLYNLFIKEEIQRIKASNPRISHREAFSTAAKNWAHFPRIHFGLKMEGNKRTKLDDEIAGEGT